MTNERKKLEKGGRMGTIIMMLIVLSLFLFECTAQNYTYIEVKERCGYCNEGDCETNHLILGSCERLCSVCSGLCIDYYTLELIAPNQYSLASFNDSSCLLQKGVAVGVVCDSCFSDNDFLCSSFYLDCGVDGSNADEIWTFFFIISTLFVLFAIFGALAFAVYFFYYRKQVKYDHIEEDNNNNYYPPSGGYNSNNYNANPNPIVPSSNPDQQIERNPLNEEL